MRPDTENKYEASVDLIAEASRSFWLDHGASARNKLHKQDDEGDHQQ